jgi:ABC-type transporter Mla MlaB component
VANSALPVPPHQPVMVLGGRIEPGDIPKLCARARTLLESSRRFTLRCDVGSVIADGMTLNALARVALTCRRLGRKLELHGASDELEELVIFVGLIEVLPCLPEDKTGPIREPPSGLQAWRQAEEGKEPRRVEEERDPCDPIA